MREGWLEVKLSELCDIKLGKTPARANSSYWDKEKLTGNVWLSIADLLNAEGHNVFDSREYISYEGAKLSKIVKKGTLLVSFKLTLGRLAFAGRDLYTNEAIAALTIYDDETIAREYLYYFLQFFDWVKAAGDDVKLKGMTLNKAKLKEIVVVIPPLPEQKRIVAILDEAFAGIDAAIANTEKNLANARELFESYLNAVFSQRNHLWAEMKVDSACSSVIDCVNKTAPQADSPTSFKMIRTTNVRNGLVNLMSVRYVSEDVYKVWTRRQVPCRGDVILTREAPLGEVGLLDTDEKVFLGQRLVSYRANPEVLNNKFLLYIFQSEYVQSQIKALASGSTVQHMRVPDSKNLRIVLPSLDAQGRLVNCLDFVREETRSLESIYQQKLTALAELKQSLLQKAFSGELTADKAAPDATTLKEEVYV